MKLVFGLPGAALMIAVLANFVVKVMAPAMMVVVLIGIVMMPIDLWQVRNEADT